MIFFHLLLIFSISVDETQYKQCEQLKFCYRNREVDRQYWKLLLKTCEFQPDYFQSIIFDEKNDFYIIIICLHFAMWN